MIEQTGAVRTEPSVAPDSATLSGWLQQLGTTDLGEVDPAELIDQLAALERVKSAAAARQARLTAWFDTDQRAAEESRGVPAARRGRGVAGQVALARRESPFRGRTHLGLAKVLVGEMPATLAALSAGEISEWAAMLMARETATLTKADRATVDARLGPQLSGWGEARIGAEAKKLGYRLDPSSAIRRVRGARSDRRVTMRPAPDTMARLSVFLPVEQGVAVFAALSKVADQLRAAGDQRTRGQIMADELVARVTGLVRACDVPVVVNLIMDAGSLFAQDDHPADVTGYGPIPAATARDLIRNPRAAAWVRRLFTDPDTGSLVSMDARKRVFTPAMRDLLTFRDRTCRTPWCDALIRHGDHVVEHARGGESTLENGQGLCEACNYTKSQAGWSAKVMALHPDRPVGRAARHTVQITSPTGHTYTSTAPDPPGRPPQSASVVEEYFERLLAS